MKPLAVAALLLAQICWAASSWDAYRRKGFLSVSPNGEYAFWSRTPFYYWVAFSWKIPVNLIMGGEGHYLVGVKNALIDKEGAAVFDGLGRGTGHWSQDGNRYELVSKKGTILYLLPERKKIVLGEDCFNWIESSTGTIFALKLHPGPEGDAFSIVRLALPDGSAQKMAEFPAPSENLGSIYLRVCGSDFKVALEHTASPGAEKPPTMSVLTWTMGPQWGEARSKDFPWDPARRAERIESLCDWDK
jgi:hypothetical protein